MNVNENTIKGKWLEIKGELQKAWGKITDDEFEQTKGDMKAIGGLIQQKYGNAQTDYERKLSDIFNRYDSKKDQVVNNIKNSLKN
ncbi:MAG: CsbD family protein [Pseudobdellovibrio sp.]